MTGAPGGTRGGGAGLLPAQSGRASTEGSARA
eukprot:CAMPEP_0179297892 /NCGR_PEP_ID=MMETSP0797-20121207/45704_1 /TAXON_ID=47934 /ORGANISM="Dinophysis acuminata, Strain DAEP01" /LENGTH=31 /DNA_ID= /DNA_START= /DNA_END= /DNA_ORIENTATION=